MLLMLLVLKENAVMEEQLIKQATLHQKVESTKTRLILAMDISTMTHQIWQ